MKADKVSRVGECLIEFKDVCKEYQLKEGQADKFLDSINQQFSVKKNKTFHAVRDVSFKVFKGDIVGIIGRNGAGKSTLLKLITGVSYPTTGEISVKGPVTSILDIGAGFHPDLSGRDNVLLNGQIVGLSEAYIRQQMPKIIAFSDIGAYIDQPVKHYSNGMYLRLAFSNFLHLKPNILLLDEVLSVGDAVFQQASAEKMLELTRHAGAVVIVSHNINDLIKLCNRFILIENGFMIQDSNNIQVAYDYLLESRSKVYAQNQNDSTVLGNAQESHVYPGKNEIEEKSPVKSNIDSNSTKGERSSIEQSPETEPEREFDNQLFWDEHVDNRELETELFRIISVKVQHQHPTLRQKRPSVFYRTDSIEVEVEFENKTVNDQLDVLLFVGDIFSNPLLMTASFLKEIQTHKSGPGIYRSTCIFPSHFFSTSYVFINLVMLKNLSENVKIIRDIVHFKVSEQQEEAPFLGRMRESPAIFAPILDWKLEKIESN